MEDIHIQGFKGVYIIPTVDFDSTKGTCEISGESFLEETSKFYSPLLEWIKEYAGKNSSLCFDFKLTYFNTSSSKWIMNILLVLKKFEENGGKLTVNWYYFADDPEMKDDIEDYVMDSGLKVNMFPF